MIFKDFLPDYIINQSRGLGDLSQYYFFARLESSLPIKIILDCVRLCSFRRRIHLLIFGVTQFLLNLRTLFN